MGITRILSAIALVSAASIWSISALVPKAAVGQPGAATLAERFPRADEMFRPVSFRATDATATWAKTDWQVGVNDCLANEWPFLSSQCFPTPRAAAAVPAVTIEPQVDERQPELVRVAVAAPEGNASAAACKQNLAAATARLEHALAQIKGVKPSNGADRCTAYRRHFFEIVKAREVTARCTSGAQRARELGTIDVAVENLNGTIAQTCGS